MQAVTLITGQLSSYILYKCSVILDTAQCQSQCYSDQGDCYIAFQHFSCFSHITISTQQKLVASYIIPNSNLGGDLVASQLCVNIILATVFQCMPPCDCKNTQTCSCCSYIYVYSYSVVGYLAIQLSIYIDITIICSHDMQLWLIASYIANQLTR